MMENSLLIEACTGGCKETVLRLLEKCPADIDKVGYELFNEKIIGGVTPLYCAAASGHLDITKTLLQRKAFVNATTEKNLTPVRAACDAGHLEIVQCLVQNGADIEIASRKGETCLMIACRNEHYDVVKYLLNLGAAVNRKSAKGKTALHDSAASGNVKIFEELLKHGAESLPDSTGVTPILRAALNGHFSMLPYILENCNLTKEETVNVLQLFGAACLDLNGDIVSAFEFWEMAIDLRYASNESLLEKSPFACYFDATEVSTLHQLRDLVSDTDEMMLQSLLVRERILGPVHETTIHYIYREGMKYIKRGDIKKGMLFFMYVLEMQPPLSEERTKAFMFLPAIFDSLIPNIQHHIAEDLSSILLRVFEKYVEEIKRTIEQRLNEDLNNNTHFDFICVSLSFIKLICLLENYFSEKVKRNLNNCIYQLVKLDPKTKKGQSLLHLACLGMQTFLKVGSPVQYKKIIDMLLNLGASPDARDSNGNTPLHISAKANPFDEDVFKTLLSYKAHLDVCNNERQTPYQLLQHASHLDVCPLQYINLQCLCAKVIRSYKIPYEDISKDLQETVNTH